MSLRSILASEGLSRTSGVDDDASGGLYFQMFAQAAAPFEKRAEQFRRWLNQQTPGVVWEVHKNSWGPTWFTAGGAQQGFAIAPKIKRSGIGRSPTFSLVARAPNAFGEARSRVESWEFSAIYVENLYRTLSVKGSKPPSLAVLQEYVAKNVPDLRKAFRLPPDPSAPPPVIAYSPAEVKKIIGATRTWLELETDTPHDLSWSTRDHGDVGDERPGREDIAEAKRLIALVKEKFPQAKAGVSTFDEWTTLTFEF